MQKSKASSVGKSRDEKLVDVAWASVDLDALKPITVEMDPTLHRKIRSHGAVATKDANMAKARKPSREILEGLKAIKRGQGRRFCVPETFDVKAIRDGLKLSQTVFAALLGVSVRTLQDWEQGRRTPRGPAYSLLRVAALHPKALLG